jgi:hypothetical protein
MAHRAGYILEAMDNEHAGIEGGDETISPDIVSRKERPVDPGEAVLREKEKYGEDSIDPNRDDQFDEHHGTPDDIV